MIKFFRNIRKTLAAENKVWAYSRYAIGEIVLVVIGILIALGINSKYNDVQNEKKIQAILKQVQSELLTDIKDAHRIFGGYIQADSLAYDILHDSLTPEKFIAHPVTIGFMGSYFSFSNKKTGYERFMQNLENLPEKYNSLLPLFNYLFRELQNDLDDSNEQFKKIVLENGERDFHSKPWIFELYLRNYSEQNVNKFLNDPYLKNETAQYMQTLGNLSQTVNSYRVSSIKLYKKIDSLLGNTSTNDSKFLQILPNKENYQPYLGDYNLVSGSNIFYPIFSVEAENNQLILNINSNSKLQLFWDDDNYYYNPEFGVIWQFYINKQGKWNLKASNGITPLIYEKEN